MSDEVAVTQRDAILEIRLNRPLKKNALTTAMYGAIADAMAAGEKNDAVRVILLTAEGAVFTAGNDLADFLAVGTSASNDALQHVERFLRALVMAEKPLFAAVAGDGVGVGTTMLLHCDVVIIAEDANLVTPFTSLGLTPEAGSSLLLPDLIGHRRAFAMLALGQPLNGKDAARLGLATEAVPRVDVEARARRAAEICAAKPPEAVRITKRLMRDREAIAKRTEQEGAYFQERLRSPEAKAAFEAFFKRSDNT
jgi:enoyl-CoA hydratase/carnithine racemase